MPGAWWAGAAAVPLTICLGGGARCNASCLPGGRGLGGVDRMAGLAVLGGTDPTAGVKEGWEFMERRTWADDMGGRKCFVTWGKHTEPVAGCCAGDLAGRMPCNGAGGGRDGVVRAVRRGQHASLPEQKLRSSEKRCYTMELSMYMRVCYHRACRKQRAP